MKLEFEVMKEDLKRKNLMVTALRKENGAISEANNHLEKYSSKIIVIGNSKNFLEK